MIIRQVRGTIEMKIATYNVNSIRSRMHIVSPWLQKNSPDFFCMQETKVGDDKFPENEFADAGYQVIFKGSGKNSGVAIASKHKPQTIILGLD
ncbi:MAG: endonuclease/exonuclease/phosphatase family protein, partial [Smithella sp.]